MEEHQDKLNSICRLCRKDIELGQRYVNKKSERQLQDRNLKTFQL